MPILKDLREARHLPIFQNLPPPVQEKVCQIEVLYDRAVLYLWAEEGMPIGVPDFKSYLRDLYENRIKGIKRDLEDSIMKINANDFYPGWNYETCIKSLGDSRYDSPPDSAHHVMMFL